MTLFVFCFLQHLPFKGEKAPTIYPPLQKAVVILCWFENPCNTWGGIAVGSAGPWWLICSHCASRPRLPSLQFPGAFAWLSLDGNEPNRWNRWLWWLERWKRLGTKTTVDFGGGYFFCCFLYIWGIPPWKRWI